MMIEIHFRFCTETKAYRISPNQFVYNYHHHHCCCCCNPYVCLARSLKKVVFSFLQFQFGNYPKLFPSEKKAKLFSFSKIFDWKNETNRALNVQLPTLNECSMLTQGPIRIHSHRQTPKHRTIIAYLIVFSEERKKQFIS